MISCQQPIQSVHKVPVCFVIMQIITWLVGRSKHVKFSLIFFSHFSFGFDVTGLTNITGCSALIINYFFFNSHSGGWSPNWVHSARRPLNGLLYLPRVIMMMENLVEWRLAGKPKYSEKTCTSATLSTTNPTWPDPGLNQGRRCGKPATNCLSYGAALSTIY
jgi:hypothetical protein